MYHTTLQFHVSFNIIPLHAGASQSYSFTLVQHSIVHNSYTFMFRRTLQCRSMPIEYYSSTMIHCITKHYKFMLVST